MSSLVIRIFALFTAGLYLIASGSLHASDCENPDVLHLTSNPPSQSTEPPEKYLPFRDYLEEATGKKIVFVATKAYSERLLSLQKGRLDIARLGPSAYVQGRARSQNIQAFAAYYMKAGRTQPEGIGYRSILIVRSESSYHSVESLEGKRLALVDPGSNTGYLAPHVLFSDDIGMSLEQYFSRILISGQHQLSIRGLAAGKVEAAFVSTIVFDAMVDAGEFELTNFRVIWRSPTIPQDPFVYRTTLCADLKQRISDALLNMHHHPAGKLWLQKFNASKIVSVDDEDYNIVRQLRSRRKDDKKATN